MAKHSGRVMQQQEDAVINHQSSDDVSLVPQVESATTFWYQCPLHRRVHSPVKKKQ